MENGILFPEKDVVPLGSKTEKGMFFFFIFLQSTVVLQL